MPGKRFLGYKRTPATSEEGLALTYEPPVLECQPLRIQLVTGIAAAPP
jgi:hypothetical protein